MEHFYQNIDGWFDDPVDLELYSDMVKKYPSGSHFVEIGSFKGKSACLMAVEIINSGKNIKFDCIDTWQGSPEHQHMPEIRNNTLFDEFKNNISTVADRVCYHRGLSTEMAKLYDDESLDFIFIDADHGYNAVKADLNSWYPKLKKGGTIAGHDYGNPHNGVKRAVDEFFDHHKKTVQSTKHIWRVE